jgi:general secretion pathway protein G
MHAATYTRPASAALILLAAICGISMPVYRLGNETQPNRHVRITADIQHINAQLKLYKTINSCYPTTEQGLQTLVVRPDGDPRPTRWYQSYKEVPKDPWQNPYIYACPGVRHPDSYDPYSAGPDRKPDTADDDWGE